MAIVMNLEWDGGSAAQYDQVRKIVNWEGNRPRGGLFHVAAITPAGLRVTDLWETAEDFNHFVEQRLMAGVKEAGIEGQPKIVVHTVHALYTPAFQRV